MLRSGAGTSSCVSITGLVAGCWLAGHHGEIGWKIAALCVCLGGGGGRTRHAVRMFSSQHLIL